MSRGAKIDALRFTILGREFLTRRNGAPKRGVPAETRTHGCVADPANQEEPLVVDREGQLQINRA
jgi:hypothetical protein